MRHVTHPRSSFRSNAFVSVVFLWFHDPPSYVPPLEDQQRQQQWREDIGADVRQVLRLGLGPPGAGALVITPDGSERSRQLGQTERTSVDPIEGQP
jgi:hypothetical protein